MTYVDTLFYSTNIPTSFFLSTNSIDDVYFLNFFGYINKNFYVSLIVNINRASYKKDNS